MIAPQHLHQLIEALELVAADYEAQRNALPSFVHVPDEVAITLGSAVELVTQAADTEPLTAKQLASLNELDAIFAVKSGHNHESFWTEGAMQHDETWKKTRVLAGKILRSLNQPVRDPDLSWIQYVPAKSAG